MADDKRPRAPVNEEKLAESKEQINEAKQAAKEYEETTETNEGEGMLPNEDPAWRETGFSPT